MGIDDFLKYRDKSISSEDEELFYTKIYLYVPYKDKDEVKKLGAKYDINQKKWYIEYKNKELIEKYGKEIIKNEKIYMDIPFKYKNIAKCNNANWDNLLKKWYVYNNNEKEIILNYVIDAEQMDL